MNNKISFKNKFFENQFHKQKKQLHKQKNKLYKQKY